jgi:hypothetical protein
MRWPWRKMGVGSVLALIAVSALAGGVLSLSLRDDSGSGGNSAVQVAGSRDGNARSEGAPPRFRRLTAKQRLARRREFHAALAKELGVSTDRVADAFRNLLKKRLDKAVDDKRLTQKQADRMLKCYDTAACKPPGPRGRHRFGGPHPGGPPPGGPPPGGPPPFGEPPM